MGFPEANVVDQGVDGGGTLGLVYALDVGVEAKVLLDREPRPESVLKTVFKTVLKTVFKTVFKNMNMKVSIVSYEGPRSQTGR